MSEAIGIKIVKTRKPNVYFGCGRRFMQGTKMQRSFVEEFLERVGG